jgi:hypothetical protein
MTGQNPHAWMGKRPRIRDSGRVVVVRRRCRWDACRLSEVLPARSLPGVDHDNIGPGVGRRHRGGEARRAGAYDHNFCTYRAPVRPAEPVLDADCPLRLARPPLRLDNITGVRRLEAGADVRLTVHHEEAVETSPDAAEQPSRPRAPGGDPGDPDVRG